MSELAKIRQMWHVPNFQILRKYVSCSQRGRKVIRELVFRPSALATCSVSLQTAVWRVTLHTEAHQMHWLNVLLTKRPSTLAAQLVRQVVAQFMGTFRYSLSPRSTINSLFKALSMCLRRRDRWHSNWNNGPCSIKRFMGTRTLLSLGSTKRSSIPSNYWNCLLYTSPSPRDA